MKDSEIVDKNTIDLTPLVEPDEGIQEKKAIEYLRYAERLISIEKIKRGAKEGEKRSLHQMKQIKLKTNND